jgi:hypothetical protein
MLRGEFCYSRIWISQRFAYIRIDGMDCWWGTTQSLNYTFFSGFLRFYWLLVRIFCSMYFNDFIFFSLKKNTTERADLNTLLVSVLSFLLHNISACCFSIIHSINNTNKRVKINKSLLGYNKYVDLIPTLEMKMNDAVMVARNSNWRSSQMCDLFFIFCVLRVKKQTNKPRNKSKNINV